MKKRVVSISMILVLMLVATAFPVANAQPVYAAGKNGLKTPVITTKTMSRTSVKIKWGKIKNADGYVIYKYNKKANKYKKIKLISNGNTTSHIKKKLKKNRSYSFKIRAFKRVNGQKKYSSYSEAKEGVAGTLKAEITNYMTIQSSERIGVEIRYNARNDKANGFQLYKSNSKDGKYKRICTVEAIYTTHPPFGSVAYYNDENVDPGGEYYYKARAYKIVKGKRLYGEPGKPVAIKALNSIPKAKAQFFDEDGTTVNEIKIAITNDPYNGKLGIVEKNSRSTLQYQKEPIYINQYSYDDADYIPFDKTISLLPGQTVYMKLGKKNGEPFLFLKSGMLVLPLEYDRLPATVYALCFNIDVETSKVDYLFGWILF